VGRSVFLSHAPSQGCGSQVLALLLHAFTQNDYIRLVTHEEGHVLWE